MPDTTAPGLCEASAFLPLALREEMLRAHPSVDRKLVVDDLVCALGAHRGGEHHAVVYDHFADPGAGALWTRWQHGTEPDTVQLRPDCPARSEHGAACGHFTAHPGPHSFETEEPS